PLGPLDATGRRGQTGRRGPVMQPTTVRAQGLAVYQPDYAKVDDVAKMHGLMRARPLATLVSAGAGGLYASHLPTVLKEEGPFGPMEWHLARANAHVRDLAEGIEALMIFHGPESYITPGWYASKARGGKVVPTWNFAVVHAYGRPAVMQDPDWLKRHVA